jgi:arylsulfatase A-like enzyme
MLELCKMRRFNSAILLAVGLSLVSGGASTSHGAIQNAGHSPQNKQPNFVFIMTDDQDLHLDSLNYMPKLQRLVGDEGTVFERHFCTIAVCCPSRVSLMTGKLAHNTNVTDVYPPYGKNRKAETLNLLADFISNTLSRWLSQVRVRRSQ